MEEENEAKLPGLFPEGGDRPKKFFDKKTIMISCRVHPGESLASFMFNGLIDLLMEKSAQSKALLKNYVFKIVPAMNPDGVYRGYYRLDTLG